MKKIKSLSWGCCHKLASLSKLLCVSHSRSSRYPRGEVLSHAFCQIPCQSRLQMMQRRHNLCHALMAVAISVPLWVRHVCWSEVCRAEERKLFLGKWPRAAGTTRISSSSAVLQPWVASPGESGRLTCATCFTTTWSMLKKGFIDAAEFSSSVWQSC